MPVIDRSMKNYLFYGKQFCLLTWEEKFYIAAKMQFISYSDVNHNERDLEYIVITNAIRKDRFEDLAKLIGDTWRPNET